MSNKILINASILTGNKNGVEVYTIEVLKRIIPVLKSNGYFVEVYSYDTDLLLDYNIKAKKIGVSRFFHFIFANNRSFHRIFWNLFQLPKIAKSFDVVYSPCTYGSYKIKNQIVTVHDLISLKFPFNHLFQFFYFKAIVPLILKKSSIISISNFTKESIKFHYKIKEEAIKTIYNGSDHLKVLQENSKLHKIINLEPNSYFLIVGLSYSHKNGLRILEVIEKLAESKCKFVIVGRGTPYFKKIQEIALNKKLESIVFFENISDEMLSCLYANCLANIYLSLFEGFGFPPLEAAYYNKISIISDTTALPEVYKDHAIFVDPYDVDSIKDKISMFIEDYENSSLIELDLTTLTSKYKWSKSVNEIFDMIKSKCM